MKGNAVGSRQLGFLAPGRPAVVARAPARLDVMGGIADYSGATVLELPLACSVRVAAQETDDGLLMARTGGPTVSPDAFDDVVVPATILAEGEPAAAPERLRAVLNTPRTGWATYVLGPLALLRAEGLLPPVAGLRLAVWSDVPVGAGVASSAALEVAALRALQALWGLSLEPLQVAWLAQQVEHRVAGAPCGIMDQATSALGQADHLLMLRCQEAAGRPAQVMGQLALPQGVTVMGIESGVAHRVGGGQYGRVRTATYMGRALISAINASDPPGGYLCNLAPDRFLADYAEHLPLEMRGAAFLAQHGETGDTVTQVDPEATYRVGDCTTHPIMEQANVDAFLAALRRFAETDDRTALAAAGAAMYRSHDSYGLRCGLGTPETDLIVQLVQQRGPARGLYGAKITGGGTGGTVAVLGAGDGVREALEEIVAAYTRRSGNAARLIAGSSDGALAWPVQHVTVDEEGALDER